MRRLGYLVPVFAMAAGLLAAPVAAAPDFVLTGSHTGWVDVVVPGNRSFSIGGVSVTTNGRFGGFYAQQLTSTVGPTPAAYSTGRIAVRHLMADRTLSQPESVGGPSQLTSGVIRFYLVADGPTTVRIQVMGEGLPRATFRPTRRTSATVTTTALRRTGDTWAGRRPYRAERSVAVVGLVAEGTRVNLAQPEHCATEPGAACGDPVTYRATTALAARAARQGHPDGAGAAAYWVAGYRDYDGGGEARYSLATNPLVTTVTRATGVLLVLKLA